MDLLPPRVCSRNILQCTLLGSARRADSIRRRQWRISVGFQLRAGDDRVDLHQPLIAPCNRRHRHRCPLVSAGFDDPDIQAYYKYMVDMAVMLGAPKERAESELKDSLLFEIQLANVSARRSVQRPGGEGRGQGSTGEARPGVTRSVRRLFAGGPVGRRCR